MLNEKDFIPNKKNYQLPQKFNTCWKSPSNIAIIKYWGKKTPQIPLNSSLSLTLSNCNTISSMDFSIKAKKDDGINIKFFFEGREKKHFEKKIKTFFELIIPYAPYLKDYHITINSQNSFPHSTGIASSASAFSSLALCIVSLEKEILNLDDDFFFRKASFLSRLGSGSACRSINGSVCVWGESSHIKGSSNIYAVEFPYSINKVYDDIQNTILIVDKNKKTVSSSQGHDLVNKNKFVKVKNQISNDNMYKVKATLKNGDLLEMGRIAEQEALNLHAMMMTSNPYFILMKPNTLNIIEKIIQFRGEQKNGMFFTMDAGANVHLLYPKDQKEKVRSFISSQLLQYCQDNHCIHDQSGKGSIKILND